jgi:hypothetical protein
LWCGMAEGRGQYGGWVAENRELELCGFRPAPIGFFLNPNKSWDFFLVRPAGRTYLKVKVLYRPDRRNC